MLMRFLSEISRMSLCMFLELIISRLKNVHSIKDNKSKNCQNTPKKRQDKKIKKEK